MPAFHLVQQATSGITMINIGTGPSNARNITDHVAVLRPHAWLMLGHCAGLRNTQKLGDYVLAHGYVREDHVLDEELPLWVPVPALAEMQVALEQAVGEVTGLSGFELKGVMRTGTVASVDNRNWELGDHVATIRRLSQSRAIALDMESAAVAANGFRFRVPYGTLLCVSDKPLHGEIKLAGMAGDFYRRRVGQHLEIGLRALGKAQVPRTRTAAFAQVEELCRGRVPVSDGTRIPAGAIHERRLVCLCSSARRYKERRLLARNGHADSVARCPLSRPKRKTFARMRFSVFDPETDIGAVLWPSRLTSHRPGNAAYLPKLQSAAERVSGLVCVMTT